MFSSRIKEVQNVCLKIVDINLPVNLSQSVINCVRGASTSAISFILVDEEKTSLNEVSEVKKERKLFMSKSSIDRSYVKMYRCFTLRRKLSDKFSGAKHNVQILIMSSGRIERKVGV